MQQEFRLSLLQVGLMKTAYSGALGFGQAPMGLLASRVGAGRLLALGTFGLALGFILLGRIPTYWGLLLVLLCAGLGASVQHPLASSLVARAFQSGKLRLALGTYNFSGDVGKLVIPETASLLGTIRAISEKTRTQLWEGVRQLARGIAGAYGTEAQVTIQEGTPVLINDAHAAELVSEVAGDLIGPSHFRMIPRPIMPSEDFSYILQQVPGTMAFLGARSDGEGPVAPVHSNRMMLNEAAMVTGAALHAAVALRFLQTPRPQRTA